MKARPVSGVIAAAVLWVVLLACPAMASDQIFRCGNNTAVRGDSTVRVLSLCGQPDFKEQLGDKGEGTVVKSDQGVASFKGEKKRVEKWHYNRGVGDYVYALTFENGVLESVESTGRGY
jgi:hypothetical protein